MSNTITHDDYEALVYRVAWMMNPDQGNQHVHAHVEILPKDVTFPLSQDDYPEPVVAWVDHVRPSVTHDLHVVVGVKALDPDEMDEVQRNCNGAFEVLAPWTDQQDLMRVGSRLQARVVKAFVEHVYGEDPERVFPEPYDVGPFVPGKVDYAVIDCREMLTR